MVKCGTVRVRDRITTLALTTIFCDDNRKLWTENGIRNIRSQVFSFPAGPAPSTFVPGTVRSRELSFPRTNKPCRPFPGLRPQHYKVIIVCVKAEVLGLLWKQDEVKCQQATNKIQ